jgi:hypothetical protein
MTKYHEDGSPKGEKSNQIAGMQAAIKGLEAEIKKLKETAPINHANDVITKYLFLETNYTRESFVKWFNFYSMRWLKANSEELKIKLYEEVIRSISAEELTKLEVSKDTWKAKLSTPECYKSLNDDIKKWFKLL